MPKQPGDVILQQGGMRKLSTRDKRLMQTVSLTEPELLADRMGSNTINNMSELLAEMEAQKSPKRKAILATEYNRLLELNAPEVPDIAITVGQKQTPDPMSFLDKIISIFK